MAVVLQEAPSEFDFTVHDVVSMGRTPHRRGWERHRREDEALVADALHRVGLGGFERRSYRSLSGGEKQRTLVARALVQQAPALILDEPTNHLDMRYQLEILRLVKELGTTVVAALHDLNLALLFCDQVAVLKDGRLRGWGLPQDVLTPSLIAEVYGVVADVVLHPRTGRRYLLFGAEEDSRLLSAMPEPCIAEAETAPSLITRTRR
jgi:iron complex transport system ATP-binding protein